MATSVKKTQTERERERTLDGGERERESVEKSTSVLVPLFRAQDVSERRDVRSHP